MVFQLDTLKEQHVNMSEGENATLVVQRFNDFTEPCSFRLRTIDGSASSDGAPGSHAYDYMPIDTRLSFEPGYPLGRALGCRGGSWQQRPTPSHARAR